MLGLEIIKQTIQQNSSNGMSEALRKKLAIVKINETIRPISDGWFFSGILDRILNSELSDKEKGELIEFLKTKYISLNNEIKKELDEVFGVEKQASVKSDDNVDVKGKEEIGQSKEGDSNEEAQDDSEDEHKTPAEHVIEQKPGQSIFNY